MADAELTFNGELARDFFKKISDQTKSQRKMTKKYVSSISTFVFQDIMDHFDKEKGPEGRWHAWSQAYRTHMQKIGKGANRILQDTGRLRTSFQPGNYRVAKKGIEWFNPARTRSGFPYAAHHNELADRPRTFMWLSQKALDNISEATLEFILRGV